MTEKRVVLASLDNEGRVETPGGPAFWLRYPKEPKRKKSKGETDFSAEDWRKFLEFHKVSHVDVGGWGWAQNPKDGSPYIVDGLYESKQFVELMISWENLF